MKIFRCRFRGMNADNYEIYAMYQDGFYDTADLCNQLKKGDIEKPVNSKRY